MRKGLTPSLILWVAVIGSLVVLFNSNIPSQHRKIYTIAIAISAVVVQTGISMWADRKRLRELTASLSARGFVTNFDDNAEPQVLHYIPENHHRSFKPVLSALGVVNDRPAHVAEYRYLVGHGKHTQVVRLTEVAIDMAPTIPPLTLTRRVSIFRRPLKKLLSREEDPFIAHEAFKARWDYGTLTYNSAMLLSPQLLNWLGEAPGEEEQWSIADGWLSCTWRKTFSSADELDAVFQRVLTMAQLVESGVLNMPVEG
jgi:hypothetical protein